MIWQGPEAIEEFHRLFGVWRGLAHIFVGAGRIATMEEYIDVELQATLLDRTRQLVAEDEGSVLPWLRNYDQSARRYQDEVKRILEGKEIGELSNEEIGERFHQLRNLQTQIAVYDQFGMYSGQFFESEAKRILEQRQLSPQKLLEYLAVLTNPWDLSTLQREEIACLSILCELAKDTTVAQVFANGSPREIRQNLIAKASDQVLGLVENFGWISVFIENSQLDEDHFLRQLMKMVTSLRTGAGDDAPGFWNNVLGATLDRIRLHPSENKKNATKLMAELNLSFQEVKLFEFFRGAVHTRHECEYQVGLASVHLKPIVEMICNRIGISIDHFHGFSTNEILDLLNASRTLDDFPLSRHYVCGGWYEDRLDFRQMAMAEAFEFKEQFDTSECEPQENEQIGGMGVSPGTAEGPACLVRSLDDLVNFKPGDILVAVATTVDYLACMKSAAGIITEHGGWSCHAAIVAREIGIPAIAGYRGAMKTFKDGERICFDAASGIAQRFDGPRQDESSN
jgi:phosphohistidine swiveling domain-containing protein